jgi:hypothetical protein
MTTLEIRHGCLLAEAPSRRKTGIFATKPMNQHLLLSLTNARPKRCRLPADDGFGRTAPERRAQ